MKLISQTCVRNGEKENKVGEEGSQHRLNCFEVYTSFWVTEVMSTLKE